MKYYKLNATSKCYSYVPRNKGVADSFTIGAGSHFSSNLRFTGVHSAREGEHGLRRRVTQVGKAQESSSQSTQNHRPTVRGFIIHKT